MQTYKSNEWEAVLWKYSMNRAVTLSMNFLCLYDSQSYYLLYVMDSVQHLSILHQIVMTYYIYVHCTSSAYFIFYDLLYILMSLWLHFVSTEILTCCKICTHKLATEKTFFSQWLCSILTSHSMALPTENMDPWQNVTVITDTILIHSTSCTILLPLHRDRSYVLGVTELMLVWHYVWGKYDMMTTVQWSDDIIWHKVKHFVNTTWRYTTHSQQHGIIISVTDCSPNTVVQEWGVFAGHLS